MITIVLASQTISYPTFVEVSQLSPLCIVPRNKARIYHHAHLFEEDALPSFREAQAAKLVRVGSTKHDRVCSDSSITGFPTIFGDQGVPFIFHKAWGPGPGVILWSSMILVWLRLTEKGAYKWPHLYVLSSTLCSSACWLRLVTAYR